MKAKIFSFVKVSESSMIASVRIARFIAKTLDLSISWDTSIAEFPLDILIIVNGAFAFSGNELLSSLGLAIEEADRVIWVQNDYTIIPPKEQSGAESPFRKAFRQRHQQKKAAIDYWTTCRAMSSPGQARTGHFVGSDSQYINWNCLTMEEELLFVPFQDRLAGDQLVYYGSFRKGRTEYFDRYFSMPKVPTVISSPTKKFQDAYPNCVHYSKLERIPTFIKQFGLGLYLEDKKSHTEFHSPANRFYEMLSAGLPVVFQQESRKMMELAGYNIAEFMVWDTRDISEMMEKKEKIWHAQLPFIQKAILERQGLKQHLLDIWNKVHANYSNI